MSTREERIEKYRQQLKEEADQQLAAHSEIISSFKAYAQTLGIFLDDGNFSYIPTTGIIAEYPNLLPSLDPRLIPDKEGLYNFRDLVAAFPRRYTSGTLMAPNFILLADPYFRRAMSKYNNFAPRFIDEFWKANDNAITYYISLDSDRVRLNMDNVDYREFDTWYGSAFNKQIELIDDQPVKLRPPAFLDPFDVATFFGDVYCLDLKWATDKKGVRIFYLEEIKTEEITLKIDNVTYHPVRYVHSEYEPGTNYFRHFDGAIHFYTADEYYARRDSDLNYNNKNISQIKTRSRKVFKMDGQVPVQTWINFISQFCTKNPLIHEYFDGAYPDYLTNILIKIREGQ